MTDPKGRLHPRPHQITAITEITRALAVGDRTQLISACGTGKTLTGRWYAQACEAQITAVFMPSLALVAQTLGEWRKDPAAQWPYEALVVCSDQSTAAGAAERAAEDGGNVDHRFWARVWSGVTTDPARAAAAIAKAKRHGTGGRHRGEQRAKILAWLGEDTGGRELRIVSSARCLAEGVDVPAVDGVLFADPRNAVIGIIQAVGRALRTAPGKTTATIIVPVTLPETGADDDDTDLSVSEFGHVWDVLRALKAHDERFAAEIDEAEETIRRSGSGARGGSRHHLHRVRFLIPAGVRLDEDMLTLRMVQAVGSDYGWERFYRLLCDYAEVTGGAFLPFNKTWKGVNLSGWAYRQVAVYKAGRMRASRSARLMAIPGWVWDREDGYFAENLRHLRELARTRPEGLAQPPDGPSVYKGLKDSHRLPLGNRVAEYRQLQRDGMLSDGQAAQLEALAGWDWSGGLPPDDVAMIQALREFCEFEHHPDVPEAYMEGTLPLGRWTYAVRRRKLTGRIHPALLEEIAAATPRTAKGEPAFRWLHTETQWRLAYSALRQFVMREGHARVPAFHVEHLPDSDVQLGQWCALQRFRKRRDELDPQYLTWLNAIDGWDWDPAGRRQEYGEKLDLGDEKWHGRPKGMASGCRCELCVEARRGSDRRAKQRRDQEQMSSLGGAVPAGPSRRKLTRLEQAGAKRAVLAEIAGVPLGVIRKVANGDTDIIARQHAALIDAITADMIKSQSTRTGSRGRVVSIGGERVPIGPTKAHIADLQRRGFGMTWITRELGYATTQFLGPDSSMVTRRVAEQVADLHARTGNLVAPPHGRNQKVPRLADLLRTERLEISA